MTPAEDDYPKIASLADNGDAEAHRILAEVNKWREIDENERRVYGLYEDDGS